MNENEIIETNDAVIQAIRDEYDKKIEELNKQHQEELERVRKEADERTIAQVRALISGRENQAPQPQVEEEEKSFFDKVLEETRNNFGIGGK